MNMISKLDLKTRIKRWIRRWIRRLLIFIPILFFFDLITSPIYTGGDSYVSFSPDGVYRLDEIITKKYETPIFVFTNLTENKIVRIYRPSRDTLLVGSDIWLCHDWEQDDNGAWRGYERLCDGYTQGGDELEIELPPSLWDQAITWLTVDTEVPLPNINVIRVNPSWPPVTKKQAKRYVDSPRNSLWYKLFGN